MRRTSTPSEPAGLSSREAQFEKVLREQVDVVFDLMGGDTQKRSFLVLKGGQTVRLSSLF
jgi:NADPH:quinone reductase-like Zn-dependent oxidoreductase